MIHWKFSELLEFLRPFFKDKERISSLPESETSSQFQLSELTQESDNEEQIFEPNPEFYLEVIKETSLDQAPVTPNSYATSKKNYSNLTLTTPIKKSTF